MAPIILVTGGAARINDRVFPPPRNLTALLHDCERYAFMGEALVLLDATGAERLGFPPAPPRVRQPHPALMIALDNGWSGDARLRKSGWINLYGTGKPRVHIAIMPWITGDDMIDASDPARTFQLHHRFYDRAGGVYHTGPGVTGIGLLRERYGPVHTSDPMWLPDWRKVPPASPDHQAERWYSWATPNLASIDPTSAGEHTHGYDANRAYLRSAGPLIVARGSLTHQPTRHSRFSGPEPQPFDRDRYGYWRIPVHDWPISSIPDPAGQGRPILQLDGEEYRTWWVTTQRLRLLRRLAEDGHYPYLEPVESYTAPGIRVLRRWAGAIANVVNDPVLEPVGKEIYRRTSGMLGAGARRIDRPDWRSAWIADNACWLWWKIWVAFQAGRRPIQVEVDAVWYRSHEADPVKAAPPGFEVDKAGKALGQFHVLAGAEEVEAA